MWPRLALNFWALLILLPQPSEKLDYKCWLSEDFKTKIDTVDHAVQCSSDYFATCSSVIALDKMLLLASKQRHV